MTHFKYFLTPFLFLFISTLLLANSSQEKIFDFSQLRENQRPIIINNDSPSAITGSAAINSFTASVNKAQGTNFKILCDSIKNLSQQKVFNISFVVDKHGKVTDITSDSDNEKINALFKTLYGIETDCKWIPGKIDGKPVDVRITFIISLKFSFAAIFVNG